MMEWLERRGRRTVDLEVGLGLWTTEVTSGCVVGACGFLGGVERTEPDSGFFQGVTDLGGETAPRSLPNASVPRLLHGSGKGGWNGGRASPFPHGGRTRSNVIEKRSVCLKLME